MSPAAFGVFPTRNVVRKTLGIGLQFVGLIPKRLSQIGDLLRKRIAILLKQLIAELKQMQPPHIAVISMKSIEAGTIQARGLNGPAPLAGSTVSHLRLSGVGITGQS